jgi:transposase
MRIIGCDLHARQQTVAMLDTTTGEVVKMTLTHEGNNVREFYSKLPRPVRVGIQATGSMQWFVNLMEELEIECLVGHTAQIRAAEPRKQKHDRRDADLSLKLLLEDRFPAIWLPTEELLDLRALLRHRSSVGNNQLRITSRVVNADGFLIWSERFETDPDTQCLFRVPEKIASALIGRVRPEKTSIRKADRTPLSSRR